MRKITEAGIDIHLAIRVEACRMQGDATLEVPVVADPWRACIPPVAEDVLKSVAMTGAVNESGGFVRDWIVWRISERTERIVADVDASGVDVVLRARRAVLQVVPSAVLRHPRAFDVRFDCSVAVILTETLPTVPLRIEAEQPAWCSLIRELFALIELDDVERIGVRRVPIEKPAFRRRILEELGIPGTRLHRIGFGEHP